MGNGENQTRNILRRIEDVPFVRSVRYLTDNEPVNPGWDALLEIETATEVFHHVVAVRYSNMTASVVPRILAWCGHLERRPDQRILLLLLHVSRPAAKLLIEAEVNFADAAGNIHLALGETYNWSVIGVPESKPAPERQQLNPADLQLLFQFAADPSSVNWPVRRLEESAGVSKSKAAIARKRFATEGLINGSKKSRQLATGNQLTERLVFGYADVLRPKLALGRFRAQENTPEELLDRLRQQPPPGIRYAVTGGPAANLLQHYYRGNEIPLFVEGPTQDAAKALRLIPDRDGPITLLNAFGEVVFWKEQEGHNMAPPWLIYVELLHSGDTRAIEAAEQLRKEYLS